MMRSPTYCLLLTLTLILAGCQAPAPLYVEPFDQAEGNELPPVVLWLKPPSEELLSRCGEGRCAERPAVVLEMLRELRESLAFVDVQAGSTGDAEFRIFASAMVSFPGSATSDFGAAMVAGVTAGLAPVEVERHYHVEYLLTWHDVPLASYAYSVDYPQRFRLTLDPSEDWREVARHFVSRLIFDLQRDGAFDAERVHQRLGAADYRADLQAPAALGRYILSGDVLYHHPLLGINLVYVDLDRPGSRLDVFVYPVRHSDWSDVDAVLREELHVALDDIARMEELASLRDVRFGSPRRDLLASGDVVWSSRGEFVAPDDRHYRSVLLLFLLGDQYVKMRVSEPVEEALESARWGYAEADGLSGALRVPGESDFMKRLRGEWAAQRHEEPRSPGSASETP